MYNIYSFRVWTHGLKKNSFIHLTFIIATQGGTFNKFFFIKIIIHFWDMHTVWPKIFAKLHFFAIIYQNGCCIFFTENILSISDIFPSLPAYLALKSFQKHNFFRKKDNLAVLFVKLKVTNCLEWESM